MAATIDLIRSAASYPSYLLVDDDQTATDPAYPVRSLWVGMGAKALELTGPVGYHALRAVLEGWVPEGPQARKRRTAGRRLGRRRKGGLVEHRPGLDLTLSPPKSVSIMALLRGDHRIMAAHDRAVRRALRWVEMVLVETRVWKREEGKSVRVGAQKMVAATFRHTLSRNGDPQLHTHCAIANMVLGADSKWRSMANEELYFQIKRIDATYLNALAREIRRLGYQTVTDQSDGHFEIDGVPRAVIEAFSTRRVEIEAEMARSASCGRADPADEVARRTRTPKRVVDRVEREREWHERASKLGFSAGELVPTARQSGRERSGPHWSADPGDLWQIGCCALAGLRRYWGPSSRGPPVHSVAAKAESVGGSREIACLEGCSCASTTVRRARELLGARR